MHIIVQSEHLLVKGRIVGKHTYRIIINLYSVRYRFNGYCAVPVRNYPVELTCRHLLVKGRIGYIDFRNQFFCFIYVCTFSENIRNKFILCYVVLIGSVFKITGIADKVKPCHTKPFFVHCIIEQRVTFGNMSRTDHCIVAFANSHIQKLQSEISRHDYNFLAV